jgi:regulator of nucleoside diphosphate kinase
MRAGCASILPFFFPESAMSAAPPLIISRRDHRRLETLLESPQAVGNATAALLEDELLRADIREASDVPADVVTMNSTVTCVDDATATERRLQLVFPLQADAAAGRVSVLAPVGAALLGLSIGQSIDWPLPGGRTAQLRVTAVEAAPEPPG